MKLSCEFYTQRKSINDDFRERRRWYICISVTRPNFGTNLNLVGLLYAHAYIMNYNGMHTGRINTR